MEKVTVEIKRVKTDQVKREGSGSCCRKRGGQMWRDKHDGLRWILSTNLKVCSGAMATVCIVHVMVGNLERVG